MYFGFDRCANARRPCHTAVCVFRHYPSCGRVGDRISAPAAQESEMNEGVQIVPVVLERAGRIK